ncbi:GNAT family N-acetyltransferase [Photobacterium sp. SDRW27]|uniref:GNAT family N-acetyltransferase n=1 Tax=Photobacterium obscurum TaxID=2829490 RepID=UPI0022433AE0|nr:GNAT family N-acetyltransferase [Photobacterium obscurum]MCW8331994.1 GNAT family N-acetyltransferase [Photobacterium obscurum]
MKVVAANMKYLAPYKAYLLECFDGGIDRYASALEDPRQYLESVIAQSRGENVPDGWLPTTTYFCLSGNEVLGAIRLRHGTNEYLEQVIGHVGYETKPTARGKGVAKFMLSWVQHHALEDKVIVTCDVSNLASKKVIESCQSIYLSRAYDEEEDREVFRYQLEPM